MILSNFHTHTLYCDGKATARDMVEAALQKGFHSLGFSGHGYTSFDPAFCTSLANMPKYHAEIMALREEYAGRIDLFVGLENDSSEPQPTAGYDYTIGSVHYIWKDQTFCCVDAYAEMTRRDIQTHFQGDGLNFAKTYFESVARFAAQKPADIMGHIDVVKKFNTDGLFFDETCAAYRDAAFFALEQVAKSGMLLELNTAGFRYRGEPYPSRPLLERARELGIRIIVSADAHEPRFIDYRFSEMEEYLSACGFSERVELTHAGFVEVPLVTG